MGYLSWLWLSWFTFWPKPWPQIILVFVAVLCGALVGVERQRREKPVGLRTLIMVCLGSAVFTMMSFAFTSNTGDSGRVAAQIVTGIGFLGAGVILHGRRVITGMTTAAIIWMTAAIGMTVGAGYATGAIALSVLVNRLLVGIFLYETHYHPDLRRNVATIDFDPKNGMTRVRLEQVLVSYNLANARMEWSEPSPGLGRLDLQVYLARLHFCELMSELVEVPYVHAVHQNQPAAT